jgi:RNA polymerase sigma-70 factor, ECF subfamily
VLFGSRPSFVEKDLNSVLAACRSGHAPAQRALFKLFYGYGKSICLRYTNNPDEADDVLNEGFLKVFQHLDSYNPTHPFKAWLRTILINTAISYHRKYHKLTTDPLQPGEGLDLRHDHSDCQDVTDQLAADDILAMVQQLPVTQRTVFSLHVVDGYSLREIAELLAMNEATVRSHFLRSRLSLQQAIQGAYPHLSSAHMPVTANRTHEH